ncbi:hypothetical protein L0244_10500 [bacterium]|nr:hypothetical protein [bacterium]
MRLRSKVYLISILAVLIIAACKPNDPDAPSEERLQSLIDTRASRSRVEQVLGKGYAFYEKGTPSWTAFESPTNDDPEEVVDAGKKYSKLMFYTTMYQRTWIFLDDNEVMRAYFVASQ